MINFDEFTLYLFILLGIVAAFFLVRALIFILTALYNYFKLGHKEFMSRAKTGIKNITPLQQAKSEFFGHPFIVIGILVGIVITLIDKTFWLSAILFGSLILEALAVFASMQKYLMLKASDDYVKEQMALINSQEELK